MRRRQFLALAGGAALAPGAARAQAKVLRVGTANVQSRSSPQFTAFVKRMGDLGYIEGGNFIYDHVQVANIQAWEASYRDVVARGANIILASGPEASLKAARTAASNLPIVMIAVDYDPNARGHIASLARPGGNITGVYFQRTELASKHLQLVKELLAGKSGVTVFWDQASADYWNALQAAAPRYGLRLTGVELRERPYDYERALASLAPADREFLIANSSPFFFLDQALLNAAAIGRRTGIFVGSAEAVASGGLMTYGASLTELFGLAATYVDKIAKGARPSDLPVQQPVRFQLTLNLKTANAIGLVIPPTLLAQADEVIE
jgi:putative tryptophan/tyrosine transport system substrate-binding protein